MTSDLAILDELGSCRHIARSLGNLQSPLRRFQCSDKQTIAPPDDSALLGFRRLTPIVANQLILVSTYRPPFAASLRKPSLTSLFARQLRSRQHLTYPHHPNFCSCPTALCRMQFSSA